MIYKIQEYQSEYQLERHRLFPVTRFFTCLLLNCRGLSQSLGMSDKVSPGIQHLLRISLNFHWPTHCNRPMHNSDWSTSCKFNFNKIRIYETFLNAIFFSTTRFKVMLNWLAEWLPLRTDFTGVTLVSKDNLSVLCWCNSGDWWYLWRC